MRLAPRRPGAFAPGASLPIALGKLAAGLVTAGVVVGVTLVVAILGFGLRIPPDRVLPFVGLSAAIAIAAAGFGLALGALVRDFRTLQPLVIVLTAGSFFASGGYASVATLPPLVRSFDALWPPAYAFELLQSTMHGATAPEVVAPLAVLAAVGAASVALGIRSLARALSAE